MTNSIKDRVSFTALEANLAADLAEDSRLEQLRADLARRGIDPARPVAVISRLKVAPHDDLDRIIGRRTTYRGAEHPYLHGHTMVIVAVLKDALRGGEHAYLKDDEAIERAGGVGPNDRVEVTPFIESEERFSFVTSDPRALDLACFAEFAAKGESR